MNGGIVIVNATETREAADGHDAPRLPRARFSIARRELRADLPAALAIAGIHGLLTALAVLRVYLARQHHDEFRLPGVHQLDGIWRFLAVLVFFILGVLCGAEEAENGTLFIAFRLPVSRLRLYCEKTCGALACAAIWIVVSTLLANIVLLFGRSVVNVTNTGVVFFSPYPLIGEVFFFCGVAFFCGQAAGLITERGIVGATLGGALAIAFSFGILYLNQLLRHPRVTDPGRLEIARLMLMIFSYLGPIGASLLRILTREGR